MTLTLTLTEIKKGHKLPELVTMKMASSLVGGSHISEQQGTTLEL
jgi:hypothetical protein